MQETKVVHANVEGGLRYFHTQDSKRPADGGLLAPGNYPDISQTLLVSVAVVVNRVGPPDVVAADSTVTAITGSGAGPA